MVELTDVARRRSLLIAALAALRVKASEPELAAVHQWLDNWNGLRLIAIGVERQRYRLHLTNAELGIWRATFSRHALTSAEGFGAAPTPWGAVQEAAWSALKDDPGSVQRRDARQEIARRGDVRTADDPSLSQPLSQFREGHAGDEPQFPARRAPIMAPVYPVAL